ncbi:hypothetical protein ACFTZB_42360 [Rhodococcus sp. NPDC057014]|uniref:hypothetical protein n=1 Tax=Rhodococcus sp. NPDC057014 TaxID=3346000 RepID=UPI0036368D97
MPVPLDPAKPEDRKKQHSRQQSFATPEAAEARRDELNAERRQPGGIVVPRDQLFAHAAEAWLASRTDLKPRTRGEYENLLKPKARARKDCKGNSTVELTSSFGWCWRRPWWTATYTTTPPTA